MRAIHLVLAALVALAADRAYGFFGYNVFNEASNTYYEVITECEREGGECKEVDFGMPEQATPAPTPPPLPPTTPPPPPTAPQVFFPNWNWPFYFPTTLAPRPPPPVNPFTRQPSPVVRGVRPVYSPPRPAMRPPQPAKRPPPLAKRPPPPVTKAPLPPPTKASQPPSPGVNKAPPKKPRKNANKKKRKPKRRMRGEQEREARRRRAVGPDSFASLYNECSGGWEFDLGCSAKGKNVCCYSSSSSGSSTR